MQQNKHMLSAPTRGPKGSGRGRRPTILLADDSEQMRLLLTTYLEEAGCCVVPCNDGAQLLHRLDSHVAPDSAEAYDLIISDVRMPMLGGLQILELFGDSEVLPPMILITGFGDAQTHRRARTLGAVACFDKPFCVPDLVRVVHEILTTDRRRV